MTKRLGEAPELPQPLTVDSAFPNVDYEFKDGNLIIRARNCGKLCIYQKNIRPFAKELRELADVWENIRT